MLIKLTTIKDVLEFSRIASECVPPIIAEQHSYKVDAKSILGLFSLDLLEPFSLMTMYPADVQRFAKWQVTPDGNE